MEQRRLETAERKVGTVLAGRHRARKLDGLRIAGLRELVDHRAARITEAEQLGALVECLAGRVVACRAELDELAVTVDAHERRMTTANDQCEVRHRRWIGLEIDRREMPLEVMHADERLAGDP